MLKQVAMRQFTFFCYGTWHESPMILCFVSIHGLWSGCVNYYILVHLCLSGRIIPIWNETSPEISKEIRAFVPCSLKFGPLRRELPSLPTKTKIFGRYSKDFIEKRRVCLQEALARWVFRSRRNFNSQLSHSQILRSKWQWVTFYLYHACVLKLSTDPIKLRCKRKSLREDFPLHHSFIGFITYGRCFVRVPLTAKFTLGLLTCSMSACCCYCYCFIVVSAAISAEIILKKSVIFI